MGRLHRLELENFKSYLGKQIIGPFENFSAIVGPNGAGKSNMMDAISFVLGVQSRHLRSSHLKELIFRQDAESAPARRASVTLVYVVTKNEIEGKKEGAEIHFSRTISASGVSTYRLDSKEVTYEAYENLLQSIGVLVKARNFLVFQGDVESVASKSPAELTKLLEQISGADQLRGDYDELARKKEEAEENTIFSMQKKKMYVTQRKEVKEQKDEADLYQQRQEELADLRTQHVLWQIWRVKMVMETHQSSAEELKNTLSETQHKEDELESELQAGKKELARVSKLLGAAEKELAARSKQLDGSTPVLTETRAKLASLRKRIEDLDKSEAKVQRDRAAQQESIEGLRADMASLEEAEEELMVELDSAEGSTLQLDKKKAEEYARLREDMSARMASTRVEELAVEQELKSKQLRVQRMEAQEDSARTEMEASDKLMAEYAERSAKLRQALSDGERERQELRQSRDEVAEAISSHQKKEQELRAELEVVSMQLRDAGDDRRRGKQEERMSEAVEQMQRIFSGVHGKLVDLCRPIQRKYAQAVAVTAGKQMDAIVVDTKHVASECIRYLKDQRIGTCLFLPLDNLVQKPVPERLRTFGGRYRLCIDLVECDDKFKPAVAYALGSTLVCDTLEEAQELCFTKGERAKVVTLKGHVIGKTGAMTGGSSSRDGGGGDTNRWEEKELERLRKRKADLEETLARSRQSGPTRQQLVDIETRLKALQTRTQYSQADLKVSDEKLAQLQQQRALKEGAVRDLRRETDALRKEVASLERRAAEITQRTREVELEVFGEFSKSVGVANIREYEEDKLRRYQELVKKRTAVSEQRASLSAQLSYELKRDFAGAIQRLQQQAAEAREQGDELEAEERDLVEKEKQLRVAVRAASDKVVALTEERSEAAAAVKAVQTQRGAAVAERAALEKKLSGEEILIERQRGHLHEVLQRAQVDEVALPVVDLENNAEGGAGAGGGRGRGRKDSISSASAASEGEGEGDGDESSQAPDDEDLRWTGSQSRPSGASGSGSGARRSRSNAGAGAEDDSDASASSREATSRTSRATAASTHFSQADNPTVVRDSRKAAKVDLSSMEKYRNLSKQQIADGESDLSKRISALLTELEAMQPNMHAMERYETVVEKLRECEQELEAAKEAAAEVVASFDDVKNRRLSLFQECYQHVSEALAVIYKDLTRSSKHPLGGNAYLTLDNTDEPYLGGIRFTAMPPMKRFRDMDQLSGGEKTMAALALLFSIHSFRQAPFFVLDEVDAALDNVNVKKICNYIRQRSKEFQCVVISLKEMFFEHADILVGICKDVESLSSRVLTLDLRQYDDNQSQAQAQSQAAIPGSAAKAERERERPRPLLGSPFEAHSSSSSSVASLSRSQTPSSASASASVAHSASPWSTHGSGANVRASSSGGGRRPTAAGAAAGSPSPLPSPLLGNKRKAGERVRADRETSAGTARRPQNRPNLPEAIAEEGEEDEEGDEGDEE